MKRVLIGPTYRFTTSTVAGENRATFCGISPMRILRNSGSLAAPMTTRSKFRLALARPSLDRYVDLHVGQGLVDPAAGGVALLLVRVRRHHVAGGDLHVEGPGEGVEQVGV